MCNLSQGIKEKGRTEGENIMVQLFSRLLSAGRMEDCHRVTQDVAYRRQLIKEFNIQ